MRYLKARIISTPDPPAPDPTGFRTVLGAWGLDNSLWGTNPTPDDIRLDKSGSNLVGSGINRIQQARNAGANIGRRVNSNTDLKDANGFFSVQKWKDTFDSWWAGLGGIAGQTELREAVRDGTFRYVVAFDDFLSSTGENAFAAALTFAEIEACCQHAKGIAPWLPIVARGTNKALKNLADAVLPGTQYQYLDAGWMQYRFDNQPAIATYITNNWGDGEACGLGGVGGINLLNGGEGTPPWNLHPNSSTLFGMSPTEVETAGKTMLDDARCAGFVWWGYNGSGGPEYFAKPEIQTAFNNVRIHAIGRNDGPINIRGDLVPA